MNAAFDVELARVRGVAVVAPRSLRLCNSYGAFGTVGRERVEIVWEGSRGAADGWAWRGYEFAAAVDNVAKRPRFLAPWHYRLDWVRWIAACRGRASAPTERDGSAAWTTRLTAAMLRRDATLLRTLRVRDPFDGEDDGPTHVRATLYRYQYAPPGSDAYWTREQVGAYIKPTTLADIDDEAK